MENKKHAGPISPGCLLKRQHPGMNIHSRVLSIKNYLVQSRRVSNRRSVTTRVVLDEIILQYSVGVFHPVTAKSYYDLQAKSRSFWGMSESRDKFPLMSRSEVVASRIRADNRNSQYWNLERLGNGYSLHNEKRSRMYVTGTVFRLSFFDLRLG